MSQQAETQLRHHCATPLHDSAHEVLEAQ
ncbi:hypothetical protein SMD11_0520 [Streptomyces albireticuli]|uniref:Uncharacterized protein n=1 Tax=Streptomyces albireticuli TaxID=1940 RepID=A0A1Z2KVZ6_9ACTN|nr:hypothetical protein SMD11_0520 [Streptomyces albireticuli]